MLGINYEKNVDERNSENKVIKTICTQSLEVNDVTQKKGKNICINSFIAVLHGRYL